MSTSAAIKDVGSNLWQLLTEARKSEKSFIDANAIAVSFHSHDGSPHRGKPYFGKHRAVPLSAPATIRAEERLAKELMSEGSIQLPEGDELRLLDYQVPLKAIRSDKIGKVDLVGVMPRSNLALIELKVATSTENPRIALLELLDYWAVVRGNLDRFNDELAPKSCGPHADPAYLLIVAPNAYWRKWREPKRRRRWFEFWHLVESLEGKTKAVIRCLTLHKNEQQMPRFTLESVSIGVEGVFISEGWDDHR
jgi:hypothetical protein